METSKELSKKTKELQKMLAEHQKNMDALDLLHNYFFGDSAQYYTKSFYNDPQRMVREIIRAYEILNADKGRISGKYEELQGVLYRINERLDNIINKLMENPKLILQKESNNE